MRLYDSYLVRQESLRGGLLEPALLDIEALFDLALMSPDGRPGPAIRASRDRVVFLSFWATWCIPCRTEFGELVELRKAVGSAVDFYILTYEPPEMIRAVAEEYDLPFFSYGDERFLPTYLKTQQVLPKTFIIKNGQVKFERWGSAPWNTEHALTLLHTIIKSAG